MEDFRKRPGPHPCVLERIGKGEPGGQTGDHPLDQPADEQYRQMQMNCLADPDNRHPSLFGVRIP